MTQRPGPTLDVLETDESGVTFQIATCLEPRAAWETMLDEELDISRAWLDSYSVTAVDEAGRVWTADSLDPFVVEYVK